MEEAIGEEAASLVLLAPAVFKKEIDAHTLAADLRAIVNNPGCSDISFLCKDEVVLHASRIVLIARSPVFRSMLTNGMQETRSPEILFPEFGSKVLLPVLEYLSTGEIVSTRLTILSAFETMQAARFLIIPALEEYVFKLLQPALRNLSPATQPELFAWCFSRLAEICPNVNQLHRVTMHELSVAQAVVDLARLLRTEFLTSSPGGVCSMLDLDTMNVFLEFTRSKNQSVISIVEYLRLRSTLLWAASKVSQAKEDYLRTVLMDFEPTVFTSADTLVTLAPSDGAALNLGELKAQLSDRTWSSLQIQCIHPELLLKVLEPLGVIPTSKLMGAIRFQALHAQQASHPMRWDENSCSHGREGYEFLEGGLVVKARARTGGIVRATMPVDMLYGVCEWEVVAEELPTRQTEDGSASQNRTAMQIGVARIPQLFPPPLHPAQSTWMVGDYGCCCLEGRYFSTLDFDGFRQGSTVRVVVDVEARTCEFWVNGKACGFYFSNLPQTELYPCIQLDAGCKARIRLLSNPRYM